MAQNNQHLIVWQKWVDPFLGEENPDLEKDYEPYDAENVSEEESVPYEDNIEPLTPKNGIRVIATPMGIIPVNEHTVSGKLFNFWVGHTNFDITKNIAELIETIEGIETLDIFTRYRFRISVGKAFDDSQVMRNINKQVYGYLESYDENLK